MRKICKTPIIAAELPIPVSNLPINTYSQLLAYAIGIKPLEAKIIQSGNMILASSLLNNKPIGI